VHQVGDQPRLNGKFFFAKGLYLQSTFILHAYIYLKMPGILTSGTNGLGNSPESFCKVQCRLCSALHIQALRCS